MCNKDVHSIAKWVLSDVFFFALRDIGIPKEQLLLWHKHLVFLMMTVFSCAGSWKLGNFRLHVWEKKKTELLWNINVVSQRLHRSMNSIFSHQCGQTWSLSGVEVPAAGRVPKDPLRVWQSLLIIMPSWVSEKESNHKVLIRISVWVTGSF